MSGISLTEGQEEHEQGCQVTDKSPGLGFGAHSPTSPSSHPALRSSGFTDPYIRGSSLHLQVAPLMLPQYRPEGGPRWVLEAGPEKAKGGCGPCPQCPPCAVLRSPHLPATSLQAGNGCCWAPSIFKQLSPKSQLPYFWQKYLPGSGVCWFCPQFELCDRLLPHLFGQSGPGQRGL